MTKPQLNRFKTKNNCSAFFGVSAVISGILLLFLKTWLQEFIAASLMVLKPNSILEDSWRKPPEKTPTNIYLFNWTNPEDIYNFSTKPKFEQVGPYRFMQDIEKLNVVYNDNNTVTYNQVRRWYYDEENANGNLSDNITTINPLALFVVDQLKNLNYFLKRTTSAFLTAAVSHVHITKTANQFLIDGYGDAILDFGKYFPSIMPNLPRMDKFDWIHVRNASETFDGVFNIANGIGGKFDILNWNYNNETSHLNSSCGKVQGSAGELYSLKPSKDSLGVFLSDICRYVLLDFEEEVIVDGILGYKYIVGDSVLDNGTLIPGNECYCGGDCIPSGMLNVSYCRYDIPLFVSLPHFYGADPIYLNAVETLQPEKAKHEAYIVLEPNTALPLRVVIRTQINLLLRPVEHISLYQDVPELFFPVIWVDQTLALTSYQIIQLKIFLNTPYIIIGISVVLISIGLYLLKFIAFALFKKTYEQKRCIALTSEEIPLRENIKNGNILAIKENKDNA